MPGPIRVVLLPGMDGTGRLLQDFASRLPPYFTPRIVSYPADQILGYEALEAHVAPELQCSKPLVLLGESFSGPLALRLACRGIPNLRAVVLVATFVRNPLRWFPQSLSGMVRSPFFRISPPSWVLRRYLAGTDAPAELLESLRAVSDIVSPAVLAARGREILGVDAREALRRCPVPVLYLGGRLDRIVAPDRIIPELERIRPDLGVELLDAPHLVLQCRPVEAAEVLRRFIERSA